MSAAIVAAVEKLSRTNVPPFTIDRWRSLVRFDHSEVPS